MEERELKYVLEAILFAAGEPIGLRTLADSLELKPSEIETALSELKSEYDYEMRGLRVVRMGNRYQMTTRSEYFEEIKKVFKSHSPSALSQAALETLAIIAYKQPVTRADIEQIRGVQSSSSLNLLMDRGFVRQAGKLDVPGKPIAYETTDEFLKLVGTEKLENLPDFFDFSDGLQLAMEEMDDNQCD
jgi:segregation and condensation protein B